MNRGTTSYVLSLPLLLSLLVAFHEYYLCPTAAATTPATTTLHVRRTAAVVLLAFHSKRDHRASSGIPIHSQFMRNHGADQIQSGRRLAVVKAVAPPNECPM